MSHLAIDLEDAPVSALATLEAIRSLLNRVDAAVPEIEDLDDLARLRLLVKDLQTDFAGVVGTIDQAIRQHVDVYQTVTVLDGRHTVTGKPTKSGGSKSWDHPRTLRALIGATGGDVDAIAGALGKASQWKSTELKKLDVDPRPLSHDTASVTGFAVIIEPAVTAS